MKNFVIFCIYQYYSICDIYKKYVMNYAILKYILCLKLGISSQIVENENNFYHIVYIYLFFFFNWIYSDIGYSANFKISFFFNVNNIKVDK